MSGKSLLGVLLLSYAIAAVLGFNSCERGILKTGRAATSMLSDLGSLHDLSISFSHLPQWTNVLSHGLADAAVAADVPFVCPGFGEPGWAPFCFLNGNPLFKAFDSYQAFIQSSVVSLHDFLKGAGVVNAYGPSIVIFTILVRMLLLPVTFNQLASTQKTQALSPKLKEIREKYADNKEMQNQMTALLYQETQVNPLAGCLPALLQLPVFIALYRSFQNLASTKVLDEPFLWIPSLDGPTYGVRSTEWLTANWDMTTFTPSMGWHDTLAFLSIPFMLVIAQAVSLQVLTPPSDDPAVQQSQRILKYLPVLLGYFALSVPAGLGVYWVINNILSTVTTGGIREYFKRNPEQGFDIDLDKLANRQSNIFVNPAWGYTSMEMVVEEAKEHKVPVRKSRIPADFLPL